MKKLLIVISILLPVALSAGYYESGKSYYIHKNYEKAKGAFLSAVDADEKDGNSWYFLGEIEKNAGNFKDAETYYANAVAGRIDRKFLSLAYWNLTVLVESRGDPMQTAKVCRDFYERTGSRDAIKKIDTMIDKLLWTKNEEAQKAYLAGRDLRKTNADGALKLLSEALSIDSSFLAPRYEIAMIFLDKNDNARAASELTVIADRLPLYYGANRLLADIYYNMNSFSDAAKYYTNCIEYGVISKDTKATILLKRGNCYYSMRDYENAETDIAASTAIERNVDAMYLLSAIYINSEKYDEALAVLKKIDQGNPDNPQTLFQIGSLYYKKNDPAYSTYFDRLYTITRGKKDIPDKFNKAFLLDAKYHFANKSYPVFLNLYAALPDSMKDFDLRLMAGKANYETGANYEALKILESLSLNSEDRLILAAVYFKEGRKDKCREILLSAYRSSADLTSKALQNKVLKPEMEEIIREEKSKQLAPVTQPEQTSVTQ